MKTRELQAPVPLMHQMMMQMRNLKQIILLILGLTVGLISAVITLENLGYPVSIMQGHSSPGLRTKFQNPSPVQECCKADTNMMRSGTTYFSANMRPS